MELTAAQKHIVEIARQASMEARRSGPFLFDPADLAWPIPPLSIRIDSLRLETDYPDRRTTATEVLMRQQAGDKWIQAQRETALRLQRKLELMAVAAFSGRSLDQLETELRERSRDLKYRRQKVYQALMALLEAKPPATIIIPQWATSSEDWILEPAEETREETRARSLLATLTAELRGTLTQLAHLTDLTDQQRDQMLARELAL